MKTKTIKITDEDGIETEIKINRFIIARENALYETHISPFQIFNRDFFLNSDTNKAKFFVKKSQYQAYIRDKYFKLINPNYKEPNIEQRIKDSEKQIHMSQDKK